jgi:hypothetical protein
MEGLPHGVLDVNIKAGNETAVMRGLTKAMKDYTAYKHEQKG